MQDPLKLYIIVDASLSPGMQVAQASHAAFELSLRYPNAISDWHDVSNYVVCLSSNDLRSVVNRLQEHPESSVVRIHEPDLEGNPLVALAVRPSHHVGAMLACLPLALKQ